MKKNMIFNVMIVLVFLGVFVVWLLSALEYISVPLAWVIAVFCFALGGVFILRGIFQNTLGIAKKFYILIGAVAVIAGVLALVGTFIPGNIVLPIIAIVIVAAVLISILVVGGKKWDSGDNQTSGYKNYHERKAEKEKNKQDNDD